MTQKEELPRWMPSWKPKRVVLPLDESAVLLARAARNEALAVFVERRIRAGDPGPLELFRGFGSTSAHDLELVRVALLRTLSRRVRP